jgi:transposase-like protein
VDSPAEEAKFRLQVLTELQNRGVKDILIACVDGVKGFPEAIEAIYPQTEVQLCIVHLVRASLNYVPWKMRKPVAADLQAINRARDCNRGRAWSSGTGGEVESLSQRQPGVAAELDAHHALFQLPAGHSQGVLYHQQRGVAEPIAAQDH